MMRKLMFIGLILAIVVSSFAVAQPLPPLHKFWGDVTVNGKPAADNLLITAEIEGKEVAASYTVDGAYGYKKDKDGYFYPLNIGDPDSDRQGKTITFYVDGTKAGESIFSGPDTTRLDLSIKTTTKKGGSSGGSGSSGSSSSGDIPPPADTVVVTTTTTSSSDDSDSLGGVEATDVCISDWVCSDWLDCVNGNQNRVCVDGNRCDTEAGRPAETQDCTVPEAIQEERNDNPVEAQNNPFARITGAVIGNAGVVFGGIILLGLIVAGIFGLNALRKK